jgi:DNA-binding NarL/FixJ family response regulator
MIRVAVADDHRIVREGLAFMLADVDEIDLVGEAEDGASLLQLLDEVEVDVVLLDVRMPGMGGLETLATLRTEQPDLGVIILSMHDEPAYVARAVELGASAYLLKNTDREELVKAIHMVVEGKAYIQAELTGILIDQVTGDASTPVMSQRVTEVLRLLALGRENKQIATELGISEATVKTHLRTLYEQLDVRNRAEAVAVALRLNLIE